MYQNKHIISSVDKIRRKFLPKGLFLTPLLLGLITVSGLTIQSTAYASPTHSRSSTSATQEVYKVHFNDDKANVANARFETQLDWRNPERTLTFNIPRSHWIESVELMLAGAPSETMGRHTPIFVKLNNSKTIPLNPGGHGFDARLKLNASYIRSGQNQVKLSIPKPAGYACMTADHGLWNINLKNSFIVIKARRKIRNYQFRDLKQILSHPDFAPKSVSLIAHGEQPIALKALAAQAIALRTPNIPDFRLDNRRSDLKVIIAKRSDLKGLVSDPEILKSSGPRLFMHEGTAAKLVITGDSETEVLNMVKAFGTYDLPNVPRSIVGLGEITLQNRLSFNKKVLGTQTKLSELGKTTFSDNWGPALNQYRFDVSDRFGSEGTLNLPVFRTQDVSENSFVTVRLNGKTLSETVLNQPNTTIMTNFNSEHLLPAGNVLSIDPTLYPKSQTPCDYNSLVPGLFIEPTASIALEHTRPTPVTELSRFAANGAPFSTNNAKDTAIALTAQSNTDLSASFKVLAHLARISGSSWSEAEYHRLSSGSQDLTTGTKNTLIIGPKTKYIAPLLAGAPKTITSSFRENGSKHKAFIQKAEIERFASLNSDDVLTQYVNRQITAQNANTLKNGGLAGLYVAPNKAGVLNGVISTGPAGNFSSAVESLIKMDQWNALSGSVSRWNRKDMLMVQIAKPVPGFAAPSLEDTRPKSGQFLAGIAKTSWARSFSRISKTVTNKTSDFTKNILVAFDSRKTTPQTQDIKSAKITQPLTPARSTNASYTQSHMKQAQKAQNKNRQTAHYTDTRLRTTNHQAANIHTPYVQPNRKIVKGRAIIERQPREARSLVVNTSINRNTQSSIPQNTNIPALRLSSDSRLKNRHLQSRPDAVKNTGLQNSQSKLGTSITQSLQQTQTKLLAAFARLKSTMSRDVSNQSTSTLRQWMQDAHKKPGFILIVFFIFAYVILGLLGPLTRTNKG